MKTNYLPKDLPFLPGNSYADPKITSYHKTQLLGIQDGVITEKVTNLQQNVDQDLLSSMKAGPHIVPSSVAIRKDEVQDAIPKIAPKWLKYDR
jgi:hypothetical protein